ncbi:MAG: hypothetical protein V4714_21280 [Bacteroidota bacterium]
MKKLSLFVLLFTLVSIPLVAQSSKDPFSTSELTWFGLDFSQAKLVGSFSQYGEAGAKNGEQIKNQYFGAWNNLIINEPEKFNLKEAFNKSTLINDLSTVEKRNAAVNSDDLFTSNQPDPGRISPETIAKIVKDYKSDKSGVGLLFIVDTFSKPAEEGVIHVTFFDIASRKVLLTQKMSGEPRGFGIRNYWAGAILKVIQKSKKEYKNWAKL